MQPEPQTHLERLLARAHANPTDAKAYTAFVKELIATTVGVLGHAEPHGFQPLALTPSGSLGVCVFTHPVRYDAFTATQLPALIGRCAPIAPGRFSNGPWPTTCSCCSIPAVL